MKKLPLAILGRAALSIPVKAITYDSDSLYGRQIVCLNNLQKLKKQPYKATYRYRKNLAISNHIQRMYSDSEYAKDYIYNKEAILKGMGISLSEVKPTMSN